LLVIAVWSSGRAERIFNKKDDQRIVIDEALGFLVAVFMLPHTALYLCLGFILFRIMDIIKPLGIKKLQYLTGGLGVVADDIGAGLLTNIILQIVIRIVS
jgi:phosphatidylglycerophosphatase A